MNHTNAITCTHIATEVSPLLTNPSDWSLGGMPLNFNSLELVKRLSLKYFIIIKWLKDSFSG